MHNHERNPWEKMTFENWHSFEKLHQIHPGKSKKPIQTITF